tara:strand:- start:391 stop:597 length:207 start_codon:yes stop_codon:yes gene_type:complete
VKKFDEDKNIIKTRIGSESYSQTDKIKTTNVNILLNRVRLDKKKTLQKKIIFSFIFISIITSIIFFVV